MRLFRLRLLFPVILWVLLPLSAFAGPFLDGEAAYERGDYETAYRLFKPLAEQGYGGAQYMLGVIYANGKGVTQDYTEAANWYRKAAEQGVPYAQYALGDMYYQGQGVQQDYVLAHMWWDVAASRYPKELPTDQREESIRKRDLVASKMTPAQIDKAQRLAQKWIEKNSPEGFFSQYLGEVLKKLRSRIGPYLFIFLLFSFFYLFFILLRP